MQGNILSFTVQDGQGLISGDDGIRYTFTGAEWRENAAPYLGERVDFQPEGTQALAVYRVMGSRVGVSGARKNKVAAGLFGIFLGWLGIHKFYLGFTTPGILMLLAGTLGWILVFPPFIAGLFGLIEGIIYLTKSDQDFYQTYEVGKRQWF